MNYDFFIPPEYRGKSVEVPTHPRDPDRKEAWPKITLHIPQEACFLHILTFYGEDDESGNDDLTTNQKLAYYSKDCRHISDEDLEGVEATYLLFGRLETILARQY